MSQTPNEFKATVKNWIGRALENTHTALPGVIVSYDAKTNRATVQPTGASKAPDGRGLPYPAIYNVPLVFPAGMGGKAGVTFPIAPGDGCLLVFSDEQMNDFLSGYKGDSDDPRSHSLNDAIAIPGLYSGAVPSNISNSDDVCLFKNDALMRLNENEFSGKIGGTNFKFTDGDLIVNGISLVHHVHGGVRSGDSKTAQPE